MESDEPNEETQNGDKWDIVILHSDSLTDQAQAVCDDIRAICQSIGRSVRVEIFEELLSPGQIHTNVLDDVIENTGAVLFFRRNEFFSEPLHSFDLAACLDDRINHPESRRHWTIVPLDIETKTRVRGKATINGLAGLTVTESGQIKERSEERRRKKVEELLTRARSTSASRHADQRLLEQSIAQGRARQQRQISALIPDVPDNDASLAARALPSDAPQTAPSGSFAPGSQSMPDRRVTGRSSGLDHRTVQNEPGYQSQTTGRESLPFGNNSACPNQNPSAVNLSDTTAAVATNSLMDAPQEELAHTAVAATSRPAVSAGGNGNGEAALNDVITGEENSDLPHSVTPDYQSVSSRPPAAVPARRNQTGVATPSHDQSQLRFQRLQPQSQLHSQQPQTVSHHLPLDRSRGNQFQNERYIPTNDPRAYWDQKGARPKTTQKCSASTLPHEQCIGQLPGNRKQEQSHAATVQPKESNSQNCNMVMAESFDEELQAVTSNLQETRLTPPPSITTQEDPSNVQMAQDRSQVSPCQNQPDDNSITYKKLPAQSTFSERQRQGCSFQGGAVLPQEDLREDGPVMQTECSATADLVLHHIPSTPYASGPVYSVHQSPEGGHLPYPPAQQLFRLQHEQGIGEQNYDEYQQQQQQQQRNEHHQRQRQQRQQQPPHYEFEVMHQGALRENPQEEVLAELGIMLASSQYSNPSSDRQLPHTDATDSGRGTIDDSSAHH